jgi:hypothetical protein
MTLSAFIKRVFTGSRPERQAESDKLTNELHAQVARSRIANSNFQKTVNEFMKEREQAARRERDRWRH